MESESRRNEKSQHLRAQGGNVGSQLGSVPSHSAEECLRGPLGAPVLGISESSRCVIPLPKSAPDWVVMLSH